MKCISFLVYELERCFSSLCASLYRVFFTDCNEPSSLRCVSFMCGFCLGQIYYNTLLRKIPFPYDLGYAVSLVLSIILGTAISIQMRCICLLIFPMYCGKAGRGVMKAVALTYVVAGPITNMGMNAREVVRVFACSAQLSYNLSKEKYMLMAEPFRATALSLQSEMDQMKDALKSVRDITVPIEQELEDTEEVREKQKQSDYLDTLLALNCRSKDIETRYLKGSKTKERHHTIEQNYKRKLEYRCQYQITSAVGVCIEAFSLAYDNCIAHAPAYVGWMLCSPFKLKLVCNFINDIQRNDTCDATRQVGTGFGEGYLALENAKNALSGNLGEMEMKYEITFERELFDVQDAKETGERVMHAFEEKNILLRCVIVALNVCMALLFLRIVTAAISYHDMYLTGIEYDNVYITPYFKGLDAKRKRKGEMTLLPLKKMERSKYIDIHSMTYKMAERSKLVTHVLKVMLEVVTATTFVMLDRLFYEALDVVRQHAQLDTAHRGTHDLSVEVKGTGLLASLLRKLLYHLALGVDTSGQRSVTNKQCVPHPRAMPAIYFFKIYGGYVWILLLLYVNPYTLRLRRLICSYFYPIREKHRILHLYNDILKKRLKMQKTLRRKAVQAVRAHYLSGENLLSLRMKFPYVLGWLHALPAARMTCLICGETEPRTGQYSQNWHSCSSPKCPFVYCGECWREAGARCLACDPSLNDLSDVDSLSDDVQLRY
ncbi:protein sneaky-like isoform X2 [Trichoplusia ni]|uniref:Protein sneaky-like isoform X2 n=1 Tax=Trichoplusia ni TaxID=7111 RepID=A0A7E5WJR0_TRINI|nr:protein sneaky-like isoform X2 [Trichoplusia ni]